MVGKGRILVLAFVLGAMLLGAAPFHGVYAQR